MCGIVHSHLRCISVLTDCQSKALLRSSFNAFLSITSTLTANTAAVSSRRGIVTCISGATLAFPQHERHMYSVLIISQSQVTHCAISLLTGIREMMQLSLLLCSETKWLYTSWHSEILYLIKILYPLCPLFHCSLRYFLIPTTFAPTEILEKQFCS